MATRHAIGLQPTLPRLRPAAAIAAIWTVVAMVAVIQTVALVRLEGRADMAGSIARRLSILPLWALATPLILRSARLLPVLTAAGRPNLTALAAHVALGSAFIVATNAIVRLPLAFARDVARGGFDALFLSTMQGVAEFYPPALVIYGVIVAAGHVVSRRSRIADAPSPNAHAVVAPVTETVRAAAIDAPSDTEVPRVPVDDATAQLTDGHLTVRQWNRVHLVRLEEIDWVEAQDNYIVVHAASRAYKGRERISDVEAQLDPRRFIRIHRSTIVHTAKIREVQPLTHGDHAVILRDGTVLRVARSRRQALGEVLGLEL
jgi:hypothetical protein